MNDIATARSHRSGLTVATEVAVLVAVAALLGRQAYDALKPPPPAPPSAKVGGMAFTSYANNGAAHFGFTNLTPDVRVACMKGVVTATLSKIAIESSVVCTGEMKPNTTMTLEASWPKGAPDDVCNKESTFGKVLDWSKCEFTHLEIAPAFPPATGASGGGPPASSSASADRR